MKQARTPPTMSTKNTPPTFGIPSSFEPLSLESDWSIDFVKIAKTLRQGSHQRADKRSMGITCQNVKMDDNQGLIDGLNKMWAEFCFIFKGKISLLSYIFKELGPHKHMIYSLKIFF